MQTPTVEDEIALEEMMQERGKVRYVNRQQAATKRKQTAETDAGRRIVGGGIARVAEGINCWLQDQWAAHQGQSSGRKSAEYTLLNACDREVLAAITLRVVLNRMHISPNYTRLACHLGGQVEQELRYRLLKNKEPGLYAWALKASARASTSRHRASVMSWTAGKADIPWTPWSERLKAGVGAVLLQILIRKVGLIDVQTVKTRKGKRFNVELLVGANAATWAWIKAHDSEAMTCCPALLPMIVPPKPWTTPLDGGYYSPKHCGVRPLVKMAKRAYLKEFARCNPQPVYNAINHLQQTAWQVNREVYEVFNNLWVGHNAFAELPPASDIPLPNKPTDIETNETARREYRRECAKVWDDRKDHAKERFQVNEVKVVARQFLQYDRFYFPHEADFRGRVYAVPPALNPQASPLAKGLLRFAEGKPIATPEALRWFLIHGANTAGIDKVSFIDRVLWVTEHHDRIIATAADPYADLWWTEMDSPFCFLAFCFEYAGYQRDPKGFLSKLPIMLDGSCSGLQHFSAMLRDEETARRVNLVPSDKPQDVYKDVAESAAEALKAMENDDSPSGVPGFTVKEAAKFWLDILMDRTLVKRPVMTLSYGSTMRAHGLFMNDVLEKRLKLRGQEMDRTLCLQLSFWLAKVVWDSIEKLVKSARTAMTWLQSTAKIVSGSGRSISWLAPSGFPILQDYRETKGTRVKLALGDQIRIITLHKDTVNLDKKRQVSGIAPNFVHSMDAASLVLAVNDAKAVGINSVACVHDSFGTHAADTDRFAQAIKDSFVRMYTEHDVLEEFKEAMEGMGVELPAVPAKGSLDISQVSQSLYCFA